MMSKTGSRKKAFTIVEVLLAVSVLSIGLVAVIRSYLVLASASKVYSFYIDSVIVGKDKITQIQQSILEAGGSIPEADTSGTFTDSYDGILWSQKISTSGLKDLSQISVTISNNYNSRQINLVDYAPNKQ